MGNVHLFFIALTAYCGFAKLESSPRDLISIRGEASLVMGKATTKPTWFLFVTDESLNRHFRMELTSDQQRQLGVRTGDTVALSVRQRGPTQLPGTEQHVELHQLHHHVRQKVSEIVWVKFL
jgi:hypothetical protein